MKVDAEALSAKIKEMFPEIGQSGVDLTVTAMSDMDSWEIRLAKGKNEMSACLDSKDAENCLAGKECKAFSSEVGQFVHSYCRHSKECPV
jgi:hypothetical protein